MIKHTREDFIAASGMSAPDPVERAYAIVKGMLALARTEWGKPELTSEEFHGDPRSREWLAVL